MSVTGDALTGISTTGSYLFAISFSAQTPPLQANVGIDRSDGLPVANPIVGMGAGEMGRETIGSRMFHLVFTAAAQPAACSFTVVEVQSNPPEHIVGAPQIGDLEMGAGQTGAHMYNVWFAATAPAPTAVFQARQQGVMTVYYKAFNAEPPRPSVWLNKLVRVVHQTAARMFKVRRENRTFVVLPDRGREEV